MELKKGMREWLEEILPDTIQELVYILDLKGKLLYINRSIESLSDIKREDVIGKSIKDLSILTKDTREQFLRRIKEIAKHGKPLGMFETSIQAKGEARTFEFNSVPVRHEGKLVAIAGTARDVTEKRLQEENLRYLSELNQKVIDSIPDQLIVLDPADQSVVKANKAVAKALGMRKKELIGKRCYNIMHDSKKPCVFCPLDEVMKQKKTVREEHVHYMDGTKAYCSVTASPIFDLEGNIGQIVHITKDITKRKIAEAKLRESKDRYGRLVSNAPLGILYIDSEGKILEINRKLLSILYPGSSKSVRKVNIFTYKPLVDSGIASDFKRCLTTKENLTAERRFESSKEKRSFLRYHLTALTDDEGKVRGVEAIIEDISKRKQSEEQLRRTNMNLLTLYRTSTSLQAAEYVREILDVAIETFKSIGYDRIRIYLKKGDKLQGVRSSHLGDERFSRITLELNSENPKALQAVTKRRPVLLEEMKGKYTELLEKYDVSESASIPLISRDDVIGIISIDNKFSHDEIRKNDLNLLMTFANQIASAIESSMLYQENAKKLKTLSALYDVSSAISATLDLDKILNLIVMKIVKLLRVDVCAVLLLDEPKEKLVLETAYDATGSIAQEDIAVDESVSGTAVKDQEQQYIEDISGYPELSHFKGMSSMLSIPLILENVPIGVINLLTKKRREYQYEDLELLTSLCNQAAIIIENSKLYRKISLDKDNLSALLEISQVLSSVIDRKRLLSLLLQKSAAFTGADCGVILMNTGDSLEVDDTFGVGKEELCQVRLSSGKGLSANVAKTGKPMVVSDLKEEKDYFEIIADMRSAAMLPLQTNRGCTGVLALASKKKNNFRRFKKSITLLTNQASIALQNVEWYTDIAGFNEKLKEEVELATKELREKNIELRKMDALKSEFVSNVSHELRTPLTSISGYTKLMLMEKLGEITERQQKALGIISEESERLTRLINNVLDLSKLESGKIKFRLEEIDINSIAEGVVGTMQAQADEKGIDLILETGDIPKFKASKDLTKQVFINLLNNALKFTPKKGSITVKTSLADDGDQEKEVEVRVKDTGPGIPKSKLPKLFNKFYQVDSSMTREHGGTGLGLVICKHIVDAHKGRIWVESNKPKGSSFVFSLPLRR